MSAFSHLLVVSLSVVALGFSREARAQTADVPPQPPAPVVLASASGHSQVVLPSHMTVGDQQFDASVPGLRTYLETTRSTNPQLYEQLAPDIERLESRTTAARIALGAGLGVGAVSFAYGFLGGKDCVAPSVSDPMFSARAAEWDACNKDNMHNIALFAAIGVGSVIAGGIAWYALSPGRSDLFDFANKHNQLSPTPLRFQLGFDPTSRLAYGGAKLTF